MENDTFQALRKAVLEGEWQSVKLNHERIFKHAI